ncbi:hypothetical protein NUW54_g5277 [Trametes sanguinea]|uniref:Uncharacterized protein n=1 Tax=Trametes sanguinea TaxID=158606 RepID=A0ACC1PVK7_9APHY|nr:hypothetical protein NUW54_g5277 [Trametes sanguinea]
MRCAVESLQQSTALSDSTSTWRGVIPEHKYRARGCNLWTWQDEQRKRTYYESGGCTSTATARLEQTPLTFTFSHNHDSLRTSPHPPRLPPTPFSVSIFSASFLSASSLSFRSILPFRGTLGLRRSMRTTALSALVILGATLAAGSPLRVVVTTHQEVSSNGVIAGTHHADNLAHILQPVPYDVSITSGPVHGGRRPLCQTIKNKALEASNRFRAIFGFAPIEAVPTPDDNLIRIMPFHAQSRPKLEHGHPHGEDERNNNGRLHVLPIAFQGGRRSCCGIGVLLRMVWVMALVTVRAIRGPSTDRDSSTSSQEGIIVDGYTYDVVFDEDAEDILVPPPQYTVAVHAPIEAADAKEEKQESGFL